MNTTEENLDHLPTVYMRLNFPATRNMPNHKHTFSVAPVVDPKQSNIVSKPRSRPMTYEDLSPEQKALYDRCKADAMIPESTRLNEKLFRQVANKTAAFAEKPLPTVSQTEFDSYQNSFALSKKEADLQKLLLDQVSGHAKAV